MIQRPGRAYEILWRLSCGALLLRRQQVPIRFVYLSKLLRGKRAPSYGYENSSANATIASPHPCGRKVAQIEVTHHLIIPHDMIPCATV
jgi:hypothetical protein